MCINFYLVEILVNGGGAMKDKIVKTMKENGFLLFLFICVCIVAIGTISILTREVDKDGQNNELVILENQGGTQSIGIVEGINNSSLDLETGEIILGEDYEIVQDMDYVNNTQEEDELAESEEVFYEGQEDQVEEEIEFIDNYVEQAAMEASGQLTLPIKGEIITDFAGDKLIYSETLEEWRGHSGIDIKADLGSNVTAALAGRVSKVYEDSLWGKIIVIDHGDGLETKYSNLRTLEMVREGLDVRQGDIIATVGNSAEIESLMEAHLHFEVIKNQKTVDPRSIIR